MSAARATVSVVIAAYNGERWLGEAIASVVAQTAAPVELIVVDDGSTDASAAVAESVEAPFPIKVVRQGNAGQSAARNAGARLASGELLAFLDQDDLWMADHLSTLARRFTGNDELGWAYCDFDEIDDAGRLLATSFIRIHQLEHPKPSLVACLAGDLMVLPSASVIRGRAFWEVGGFDEALQGYEDDDLYIRMFLGGWRFAFERRALVRARAHGDNCSAGPRFLESRLRFASKLQALLPDDQRRSRYYTRDVIAPRLFSTTLDDYVRAVSAEDWAAARAAYDALEHLGALRRDGGSMRWKLAMLRDPVRFRRVLELNAALPHRLRPLKHPLLRLR